AAPQSTCRRAGARDSRWRRASPRVRGTQKVSWQPRRPACSLRARRARRHARIAGPDAADRVVDRAAVCVQVRGALRPVSTARRFARPDAALRPLELAVGGGADRATRAPLGGGTGPAEAEAVLAGVAAETDVAAGPAVVRVGGRVHAPAPAAHLSRAARVA